jgi:hypothetical protein
MDEKLLAAAGTQTDAAETANVPHRLLLLLEGKHPVPAAFEERVPFFSSRAE